MKDLLFRMLQKLGILVLVTIGFAFIVAILRMPDNAMTAIICFVFGLGATWILLGADLQELIQKLVFGDRE